MSAIATSYRITEASLAQGLEMLNRKEHQKFWEFMKTHEVATLQYSGYVLGAVIPFAQEKGMNLPRGQGVAVLSENCKKQLGVVACGQVADYRDAAKSLAELQVTDAELRQYYSELYAHDWDEAPTAMRKGFVFIQQSIRSLNTDNELLIFSIL